LDLDFLKSPKTEQPKIQDTKELTDKKLVNMSQGELNNLLNKILEKEYNIEIKEVTPF
jgi:hypothetical protein